MSKRTRKVAMCLMAHPDDCEILAGGTMLLLAERGWELHVVTMTPGDCGSATLPPEEIAAIRRAEGAAAARILGGTYHCLESRDAYVTYDEATLRKAMSLTRSISPTVMFTHALQCYMMDHEQTAMIARGVSFAYAIPNATVGPIVKGGAVPYLYYADPVGGTDVYGKAVKPATYVNIASTLTRKAKALSAHKSQRDWLMKHHGMDQYVEQMKQWGKSRGEEAGMKAAEGFRQHKAHPYPQDCVLKKELGDLVKHL